MTYVSPSALALAAATVRRSEIRRTGASNGATINKADALMQRVARRAAGVRRTNMPVEFVSGTVEPHLEGEGYYFVNRSGVRINHPSAYRAAYGNPIYVPSDQRVVVGIDWPGLALAAE